LALSLNGSINTIVDRLTGVPYRLAAGQATLGYQPFEALRLTASAGGGRALSGLTQKGQSLTLVELGGSLSLSREVALSAGARNAARFGGPEGSVTGTQWAGYAAVTFARRERL
jgi:hypothetical protein